MNVGFVFTNFNNSSLTREVIRSLEESQYSENYCIVIVDNKSSPNDIESLMQIEEEFIRVKIIYNQENVGYFSGLNIGIKYLRQSGLMLGCIVVGNNDLEFPLNFYNRLVSSQSCIDKYAVISPDLVTLDQRHQNPHVRTKISIFRKCVYEVYYFNYHLARLIKWIATISYVFSERKDYKSYQNSGVIYLGYGACYILTPVFFQYFEELWAPTFLMEEEKFLRKQLSDKGLDIFYESNILVQHHDHSSIDKVPVKKLWEISRESFNVSKKCKC